jgi:L-threonylcarbamoyladenylate synthase
MMDKEARTSADYLKDGRVILYPTDTIWGIGCDATNGNAVQRIYEIKERSDRKSMLVLMDGISMLSGYLESIPDQALDIIRSTDKPTTIIYPGARNLANNLVAADGSIGVRITRDPFCKLLLKMTGKPLVSTSANISGNPSPPSFADIETRILEEVDYVADWRRDEIPITSPSTILRIDNNGEISGLRP